MYKPQINLSNKQVKILKDMSELIIRTTIDPRKNVTSKWLKKTIIDSGTIYIKTGQLLSSRTDVLPKYLTKELKNLQDNIIIDGEQQKSMKKINKLLEHEKIEKIYPVPIASASIGCVYKGELKNGEKIAIKVKRDKIYTRVTEEFKDLDGLFSILSFFKNQSIDDTKKIINESYKQILTELDYKKECENIISFGQEYKDIKWLKVPKVYEDLSDDDIVVMEYVPGIKINDKKKLKEMNIDLEKVVDKMINFFVSQLLDVGLIHCDPHPGNISISEDGKLILYDYGLIKKIDKKMIEGFFKITSCLYSKDIDKLINLLLDYEIILTTKDIRQDKKEYTKVYNLLIYTINYLDNLDAKNFSESILKDETMLYDSNMPFELNKDLITVFRTFTILEGICKNIDPNFNYQKIIQKYAFRYILKSDFISQRIQEDIKKLQNADSLSFSNFLGNNVKLEPIKMEEDKKIINKFSKGNNIRFVFLMANIYLLNDIDILHESYWFKFPVMVYMLVRAVSIYK